MNAQEIQNTNISYYWHSIFQSISDIKYKSILEFAPGYTLKVGKGLINRDFQGIYSVIDLNKDALDFVGKNYTSLLSDAIILTEQVDIEDYIPKNKVDILVANHPIDDIILTHIAKMRDINPSNLFFSDLQNTLTTVSKIWNETEDNIIQDAITNSITSLCNLIILTNPDNIIFSNYQSNKFSKAGLDQPYYWSNLLINKLKIKLQHTYHVQIRTFAENSKFEGGWLFCQK